MIDCAPVDKDYNAFTLAPKALIFFFFFFRNFEISKLYRRMWSSLDTDTIIQYLEVKLRPKRNRASLRWN